MAHQTIHSGGSGRGIVIALVVLVLFVAGIAMLGNGSAPDGAQPLVAPTTPAAPVTPVAPATE